MGCYDIIHFQCPKCNTAMQAQSKGGDCNFRNYNLDSVPKDVAKDANRHAPHMCEKCGYKCYLDIPEDTVSLGIK